MAVLRLRNDEWLLENIPDTDLSALGFTPIDLTDGSWTLTDPDSLVNTITHSTGINKVTFNALASGNSDNAWSNGNTQRGPRWHKKLKVQDALGADVQVVSGDNFIFQAMMEYVAADQRFAASSVVCVSADGTALTATDSKIVGALLRYATTGNPQLGSIAGDFGAVNSNFNNHRVSTVFQSRATRPAGVSYLNTNSSGAHIFDGNDKPNTSYANATTDLDIIVGVGTFATGGITVGYDMKVKAWSRCIVMKEPS